ncbi:zinc finger SWIM domain-containing protein 7 homolog [Drosophila rhopaloa]|uniref:Zinc finger SWIM domain-containing protein 7 homolog n=1 Tax=Drosophila rhopaloa TaxID=1041015 RepID=A0A6P4FJA4_DRORH|nr:zinc finger SWIM domain-containing protein 7 homolog [Drosophila rhopaloa]
MALEVENCTNPFLPQLLDQIFEIYRNQAESGSLTKEESGKLFYDLSAFLGEELVFRSLQLLDDYIFTYYYFKNKNNLYVVELSKGSEYFRVLPRINYCKCDFFQCHVLQLPKGILYQDIPSGQVGILEDWSEESRVSFTCQHVLALRLHQFLCPGTKTSEQYLKKEELKNLQKEIFRD